MLALLVEDDRQTAAFVSAVLTRLGHEVRHTASAVEARVMARLTEHDMIVLDLMLPDGSGVDVLRDLRREGRTTPVLVLTGRDAAQDVVQVLDAGADDYVVKPVDADVLLARLRALLRRGGAQQADTLASGALVMQRVTRRVFVDGAELPLTNKEFGVLQHLLQRAGETISATEFLQQVWEMDFDPGSNLVNANIARLRRKLERYPSSPRIETVRGAGFRLLPPA